MNGQLGSYYLADQIDRASLDQRAARGWQALESRQSTGQSRTRTMLIAMLVVALIGLAVMSATAETLARALPGMPDGLIAELSAEEEDLTVPARPFDGRPW